MNKKITIQDIAKEANVSKSTVSRVLNDKIPVNEDKKSAVLSAMAQLNYKPNVFARGLAGGNSMTIGVITQNLGSPFYDSVTQGVIAKLSETDYSPIFVDGQWTPKIEKSAFDTLNDRQVDGLIMLGGNLSSEEIDEARGDKSVVLVARRLPDWESRSISIDNFLGSYKATQFLIEAGHTKIAHLTGIRNHADATDRLNGYRKALVDAGIEIDEELIVEGDFSSQTGVVAIESLLLRGATFTAVFSANDEMAFGARLALHRRGIRCPEDVSLIGFDNQPVSAFMTPPLTTVNQPANAMGMAAADMLLHHMKDEPYVIPDFETEIIVRESVARRQP